MSLRNNRHYHLEQKPGKASSSVSSEIAQQFLSPADFLAQTSFGGMLNHPAKHPVDSEQL